MGGELERGTEAWIGCRLNEEEYGEFRRWFKKVFLTGREERCAKLDFSNLKLDTQMWVGEEWIHIRAGQTDLRLLYSAVTELCRLPRLILFYAQKEFWAVPVRVLGCEERAREMFEFIDQKRRWDRDGRVPLEEAAKGCDGRDKVCWYYTRSVDQMIDAYGALGRRAGQMEKLRRLSIFPYRYVGVQVLALAEDGLYEDGEKWTARHAYEDLERVSCTRKCVYLIKSGGDVILVPLEPLGGQEGMERLVEACNRKRSRELPPLRPKRMMELNLKSSFGMGRRGGRAAIAAACAVILGVVIWNGAIGGKRAATDAGGNGHAVGDSAGQAAGDRAGQAAEGRDGQASGDRSGQAAGDSAGQALPEEEGLVITAPDDTVFDQVGEDGVLVSSGQFYQITLPEGQWEQRGGLDSVDYLESRWGKVIVRGFRDQNHFLMMMGMKVPKTKEDYIRRMTDNDSYGAENMPEVVEYTYREGRDGIAVRMETRFKNPAYENPDYAETEHKTEEYQYKLELSLTSPEYFYTVTAIPEKETGKSIEEARKILDSFRVLDTSSGICRKMEEETFHGYYGKNVVMTNCLVFLDRDISAKEIGDGLELVKQIHRGIFDSGNGEALAARSKDSPWLGIDCRGLQQNCTKENAKKVEKIFRSDVILYDEFDGDLLMVAYCDKEGRHADQRATSFDKETLQSEFQCYGQEQEFPEELLKYMDLTAQEAEAIWKDEEAVFQIDKLYELASHMTNPPVPMEFIGMVDYDVLKDGFEIIRK